MGSQRHMHLDAHDRSLAEWVSRLGRAHEEANEREHGARVLKLLVAYTGDGGVEQGAGARQREQQAWLEDEAAVAHLPEGGEELRLSLLDRGGTPNQSPSVAMHSVAISRHQSPSVAIGRTSGSFVEESHVQKKLTSSDMTKSRVSCSSSSY